MEKKEEKIVNKTAIFSGRYCPPHLGHILTIFELCKKFNRVVVVILDYPSREFCTAHEAKDIFDKLFKYIFNGIYDGKIYVVINNIHFAKITVSEYLSFLKSIRTNYYDSIYFSGNNRVIKHMQKLNIRHKFIGRSLDRFFEGKKIRKYLSS